MNVKSLSVFLLLILSLTSWLVVAQETDDSEDNEVPAKENVFQPDSKQDGLNSKSLSDRCIEIKAELKSKNIDVTYSQYWPLPERAGVWTLRWGDVHVPVPQVKFQYFLPFRYKKSVRDLAKNLGFVLFNDAGDAVVALHYFKTLRYVHTNGIEFIENIPEKYRTHPIIEDLAYPEARLVAGKKMFEMKKSDLDCERLGRAKKTYILGLLLVKDAYSRGELLNVYPNVGGYSGWLSLEKVNLVSGPVTSDQASHVWKAFYSGRMMPKLVNNIRIYQNARSHIPGIGLHLNAKSTTLNDKDSKPNWLIAIEQTVNDAQKYPVDKLKGTLQANGIQTLDSQK